MDAVGGPHHGLETLPDGCFDLRRLERESTRGDLSMTRGSVVCAEELTSDIANTAAPRPTTPDTATAIDGRFR